VPAAEHTTAVSAVPSLQLWLPSHPARLLRARERIRDHLSTCYVDHGKLGEIVTCIDGLVVARRHSVLFGERRLLDLLPDLEARDPEPLVRALREAIVSFAGELNDDLRLLAVRRTGQGTEFQ